MNSQFLNPRSLVGALVLVFSLGFLNVSLVASANVDPGEKGFPIIQFLGDKKAGEFALVGGNEEDGVGMGIVLKSHTIMLLLVVLKKAECGLKPAN